MLILLAAPQTASMVEKCTWKQSMTANECRYMSIWTILQTRLQSLARVSGIRRWTGLGRIREYKKSYAQESSDNTLSIILAALSASPFLSTACRPTSLLLDRLSDLNCRKRTDSVRTAILEAEMVAYNEHTEKIDEFAYVAECAHGPSAVANAFKGVHGHDGPSFVWKTSNSHEVQTDDALLESSQTSSAGQLLEQDAGAATKRHLAIVFFDCLYLNGKNLMQRTSKR